MKKSPHQLFWQEVDAIQARHQLFFPEAQKAFIVIAERGTGCQLQLLEGYHLSNVITGEIEFAFKLYFHVYKV